MENRQCFTCKEVKPISDFKFKNNRFIARCSICYLELKKNWGKGASKEQIEKIYFWNIFKHYGITREDYFSILKIQNDRCAICQRYFYDGEKLCVDHDHKTNIIRGLLCRKCNQALGSFANNKQVLRNAALYLEEPPVSIGIRNIKTGKKCRVRCAHSEEENCWRFLTLQEQLNFLGNTALPR